MLYRASAHEITDDVKVQCGNKLNKLQSRERKSCLIER